MYRLTTLTVLALAASAQHEGHGPAPATTVPASIEVGDRDIVISTPPVDLPLSHEGHGDGHDGVHAPVTDVVVPVDGYLHGFDYEVVDGDGNVLSNRIVHHVNLIDPDRQELFLPISRRLMAIGQETGRQTMPRLLLGVPISVGQRIVVLAMLHNPTPDAHEDVSVRVRLMYVKTGRPWPLMKVHPFQIDVAFPVGEKFFDLPVGPSSWSWEGSPSLPGRIMVLGSHLHDLATHITLEDVTDGTTLWTGYPVRGEDGLVNGVTVGHVWTRFGLKISPDHVYRVTVFYENDTGAPILAGGMGVVAGVFKPGGGGDWPRANVADSLYQLDYRHYMEDILPPVSSSETQAEGDHATHDGVNHSR